MDGKAWQLWSIGLQGVGLKWSDWAYILGRNATEQHGDIIPSLWSEQTGFLLISHAQFTISHFMWMTYRPSKTTTQKRCSFHYRGLEHQSRKSRDTLKTGKFGLEVQNEAGERLTVLLREHTGHRKHPLPKHKRNKDTRWSIPWSMVNMKSDYLLCSWGWRSSIQSATARLGVDWHRSWTLYGKIQTYIEESRENH